MIIQRDMYYVITLVVHGAKELMAIQGLNLKLAKQNLTQNSYNCINHKLREGGGDIPHCRTVPNSNIKSYKQ